MHDPPDEVLEQARARRSGLWKVLQVDRLIGIGGMASVFEGTHPSVERWNRVALKILHRDLARKPDMRARFLREGYAANRVRHPGAVRVLDDDEAEDGSIFLVMELLDGETLDARFERSRGRVRVSEVVALVVDVLDVLTAAHRNGVVHRDIKPENLFLTREGKVKLLDFGIALRLKTVSPTRTASGRLVRHAGVPCRRNRLWGAPKRWMRSRTYGRSEPPRSFCYRVDTSIRVRRRRR